MDEEYIFERISSKFWTTFFHFYLNESSLSDKHLVNIQQNVTTLKNININPKNSRICPEYYLTISDHRAIFNFPPHTIKKSPRPSKKTHNRPKFCNFSEINPIPVHLLQIIAKT